MSADAISRSARPGVPAPPPRRLHRRDWRETEFAALDFETTGLDRARDAIVSFGVVPVRGGRVVLGESVHQLVVPDVPSSPGSMKVHRILPRDLDIAPSLEVARELLHRSLERRFLLTWYAEVEVAFLERIFGGRRRSWVRRTIDTRRLAIELERKDPDVRESLSSAAERYGVPVASPHEALDDALVTAQLFLVLASKLEARGLRSARALARLTRA
jgi:DNA polymerase-3 subunit epsilon